MSDPEVSEIREIVENMTKPGDSIEKITRLSENKIMVRISAEHDLSAKNMFAGNKLQNYVERGYIPVSVAANKDRATAWFRPIGVGLSFD